MPDFGHFVCQGALLEPVAGVGYSADGVTALLTILPLHAAAAPLTELLLPHPSDSLLWAPSMSLAAEVGVLAAGCAAGVAAQSRGLGGAGLEGVGWRRWAGWSLGLRCSSSERCARGGAADTHTGGAASCDSVKCSSP